MKWNVGHPGGMNGPFYSIVAENGNIIAMQIPSKENAELIAKLGDIIDYDFVVTHKASRKLRQIFNNDKVKDIPAGVENYIIRSAILALFADEYITELITRD